MKTLFLASLVGLWSGLTLGAAEPAARTETPKGTYTRVELDLFAGLDDKPQKLMLGLRDGQLASFWFVMPMDGDRRLNLEAATVRLTERELRGELQLRTSSGRGQRVKSAKLILDLKRDQTRLQGRYELQMADTPYVPGQGTVTGSILAEPVAADQLQPQASWPSFAGPQGDMSSQPPPVLWPQLSQARPRWRSEAEILTGYGNAPDGRYYNRAAISGNGGGGSSPVIAQNTVYMYHYVPSPAASVPSNAPVQSVEQVLAKFPELKLNQREAGWILNHFRSLADDEVVAIDAGTGATRWRTVLPLRSPNLQTHKHRGLSAVPLVAGNRLFVPNLSSRLYALDANTGQLLWETPPGGHAPVIPSPLLAGGHLVWVAGGHIRGLDPATGTEKWKQPAGYVLPWTSGGKERLLSIAGWQTRTLSCIDPADGRLLWQQETPLIPGAPLSAVLSGDWLIGLVQVPKETGVRCTAFKLTDKGAEQVWQDQPLTVDENVPLTVAGQRVYALGAQTVRVLDLASGQRINEQKFTSHGPGSNPWLGVVGQRLLLAPEGQHGSMHLLWLDLDGRPMGPAWKPLNLDTTAYNSQPIIFPVVDGRLFVRGGNAIHCYDLRPTPAYRDLAAQLPNHKGLEWLLARCQDANPATALEALVLLTEQLQANGPGDQAAAVRQTLTSLLQVPDNARRAQAWQAAYALGPAGLDLLLAHASLTDPEFRRPALFGLGRLAQTQDERLDQALAAGLGAAEPKVVGSALSAIRARGITPPSLVNLVLGAVDSPDSIISTDAMIAYLVANPNGAAPNPRPKQFEAALMAVMGNGDGNLGALATGMALRMGPDQALALFSKILQGDNALPGIRACKGVAALGKAGLPAVPLLKQAKQKWAWSGTFNRTADSALRELAKHGPTD